LIPLRLAGGFVAYLIIFAMPWIQSRHQQSKISASAMAVFENVSLYYVWFIFLMAYVPRIMGRSPGAGGSFVEHVSLFIWVIIIFAWRFISQFKAYIAKNNGRV
jgi:hypothetical protein